jgi:hypothetical protein
MTRNPLSDVSVDSPERFLSLLKILVEKATRSGVDVSGTWEFPTRGSVHNWEVEIVELDKEFDDRATDGAADDDE